MAQTQLRALFYVDGFNLYHALHDLNRPRLKWLSLHALAQKLIPNRSERLVGVVYFSAYAFRNRFDVCYLLSGDTDLVPALRIIRAEFPTKELVSLSAPNRPHSAEILKIATRKVKVTPYVVSQCLLPAMLRAADGTTITRPAEYD